jgi:hypothetical protein
MSDMPRNDTDRPDPKVERAVASWLRDEPDRVPDELVEGALARSRASNQRLSWTARWHQRGTVAAPRALVAGAALTATLAVVAVVLGVSLWRGAPDQGTISPSAVASPDSSASVPFDGRIDATIKLDSKATAFGSGFGSLWVGDDAGQLLRINPADGSVEATIALDGIACGPIGPAATSLWLATCGVGGTTAYAVTTRVDPDANVVANVYDDGAGDGFGASAMNGLVWFISDVDQGRVTAVDAATGEHVRDLTVGSQIRHLTAGFGSLWVSPIGRPAVLRVDSETGDVSAAVALSGDAGYLTTGADAIWVAEPHQWLVGRIDPVADRVAAELAAGTGADHIAVAPNGLVWALTDDQLLAIDGSADREVDRMSVPSHVAFDGIATHVLALDEDRVWFADQDSLVRIRPSD